MSSPSPRRSTAGLAVVLVVAGLLGCRSDGDARLYARALTEADSFERARDFCQRIRDPATRGDCRVAAMEAWERLDADECRALAAEGPPELALWRDECMFQLAERLRAAGDLDGALAACVDSRFARQCAWHLVQDEAEASLGEPAAVAEARIARFAGVRRLPDAAMQFWLIRFRTAAAAGTPLDETACAGLQAPEPCREAVVRSVRLVLDARLRADRSRACPDPGAPDATLGTDPAWVDGPVIAGVVDQWRAARCAPGAPPPPPGP